ncbi:MAG: TadE/TadG family type IV pilus assembly protein [Lutisporaceae bacterium]
MKKIEIVLKHLKSKKGNSAIIFLLTSTLFIGMLAFITDAGMMYLEKSRLQNAVDAIALAAMQDYPNGEAAMLAQAYHYADLNNVNSADLLLNLSDSNKRITVTINKKVQMYFARIFDITDEMVQATASAKIGTIVAADGIRPFAVEEQTFEFGMTYILKKGASDAYTGNYGALALGGTGATNYKNNLQYGYHGEIGIGDLVEIGEDMETEPGNMAGPTYEGVSYLLEQDTCTSHDLTKLEKDCSRLIVIPVIDSFDVEGRTTVKIMGFVSFFLEETTYDGGKTEVKGKFIKTLGQGEIDETATGFGMSGVKLVE